MKIDNATVRRAFDALEAGADEVLADEPARQIKHGLSVQPAVHLLDPRADEPGSAAARR